MCGIFAVVSKQKDDLLRTNLKRVSQYRQIDAAQVVLEGLKKLEYRGYDSWGIVVEHQGKLVVDKHIGKIADAKPKLPHSSIGLGHTRWATHGGVTVSNAHPFLDCTHTIGLVHNGIIDNYLELKGKLKKNHVFTSQTDSEVLLHLIEECLTFKGDTLQGAVRKAFKQAQGLNAILVISQGKIIAAKTGSPLVVGLSQGKNFIASDLWSILDHTREVVFLEDGQVAEISAQRVNFFDLKTGKSITPKIQHINWSKQESTLQNYPHFMLKEIHEQPDIISRLLVERQADTRRLAEIINKSQGTFFVACGTAAYAALAGQYFFSKLAGVHVNPAIGSEFIYYTNFLNQKSLVIALSQSGETIDTIQSAKQAKGRGATVACLVNVLGSTLYRLSDTRILLDAGPEKAVASTKAFIAKITLLLMTAGYLNDNINQVTKNLKQAELATRTILKPDYIKKLKSVVSQLKATKSIFVVGRGPSYPAALEVALKVKEISYIHAEGLAGGELKHGPIALVEQGSPCIVIAPNDETYHDTISGAMEMKARGGFIIGITNQPHEVFDLVLPIKDCGIASLIPSVVIGQLLAYELAMSRGLDPDKPRNLAKSVTVK